MVIMLDNGHGDDTPGKRSPIWANGSQLFEWEFNRAIVSLMDKELRSYGFKTDILVPEIFDIPLSGRIRRGQNIFHNDRESFGISIHANAHLGVPGKANGWEAWTSIGETESDIIAEYLYLEAEESLPFRSRKDTRDGDSDKESRFAMVHKTSAPWVLTESGFMDNREDCKFMLTTAGRELIAHTHVVALVKFITARNL